MKHITQKIGSAVYGYNPNEFMPIFVDGQLDNRKQFVVYKIKRIVLKHSVI